MKKDISCKLKQKKAGVAIYFRTNITRDRETFHNGPILQEDTIILSVTLPEDTIILSVSLPNI